MVIRLPVGLFVIFRQPVVLCGVVLMRLQVYVLPRGVRAQGPGSLSISITFWPVFLAITGLAVNLRLVRCHGGAVQTLSAAHCGKETRETCTSCCLTGGNDFRLARLGIVMVEQWEFNTACT